MRISDWSSDVCSSDLYAVPEHFGPVVAVEYEYRPRARYACAIKRRDQPLQPPPGLSAIVGEDIAKPADHREEAPDTGDPGGDASIDDRLLRIGKHHIRPLPPHQPDIGRKRAKIGKGVGACAGHGNVAKADADPVERGGDPRLAVIGRAGDHFMKLGRASCRERVCQYV